MIIIKFNGGLGNQMFQYAFCQYCILNGIEVIIDAQQYNRIKIHEGFILPQVLKDDYVIDTISLEESDKYNRLSYLDRLINRVILKHKNHYYERYFKKKNIIDFLKKNKNRTLYLEGYWQNIEFVMPILDTMKKIIVSIENLIKFEETKKIVKSIKSSNSVSLHIRYGDYINNTHANKMYGNICTKEYYQNAITYIKTAMPDATIYVFSDDLNLCKKDYPNLELVFVDSTKKEFSYIDMFLMSLCKHHIIANSSFSWWGAFLGEEGIIIMPEKWNNREENLLSIKNAIIINQFGTKIT